MQGIFIIVGQFFGASLITFVIASIVHSQFVLAELTYIDINISLTDRLSMTLQDLWGLFPTLGPAISLSLCLGFSSVVLLNKAFKPSKAINILLFPLAGAAALWSMFAAMRPIMNITIIAGARTTLGEFFLCLSGIFGGYIFWLLTKQHRSKIPFHH